MNKTVYLVTFILFLLAKGLSGQSYYTKTHKGIYGLEQMPDYVSLMVSKFKHSPHLMG